MTPLMYAHLVKAMDQLLDDTGDERGISKEGWVYENLSQDMADAAKAVYNACMAGQKFAEQQGD